MRRAFLSYRRDDTQFITSTLYHQLDEASAFGPASVFMDIDDIPPGVDFRDVIDEAVGKCEFFLAVIGRRWVSARLMDPNDFVRLEIEAALRRNIPVTPLLVDGATMPKPEELPESLHPLLFKNCVTIRHGKDFKPDVLRLVEGLQKAKQWFEARKGERRDVSPPVGGLPILRLELTETQADQQPPVRKTGKKLPPSVSPVFADHLVRHRLTVPISQQDLADLIGVTLAAVNNWERMFGSTSLYLAARAARILGIDAELRVYNRVIPAAAVRREDLRPSNVGVKGLYQEKTQMAKLDPVDALAVCKRFAERMREAMAERGVSERQLCGLAGLTPGKFRHLSEPESYQQVPLVRCANVAHVLGMADKLADYADDDLKSLPRGTDGTSASESDASERPTHGGAASPD